MSRQDCWCRGRIVVGMGAAIFYHGGELEGSSLEEEIRALFIAKGVVCREDTQFGIYAEGDGLAIPEVRGDE